MYDTTEINDILTKAKNLNIPSDVTELIADIDSIKQKDIEQDSTMATTNQKLQDVTTKCLYLGKTYGTSEKYVTATDKLTAYKDGVTVTIVPHVDSGDNPTLNINELGETPLLDLDERPVDLKANKPYTFVRVGTSFFISSGGNKKWNIPNIKIANSGYGNTSDIHYNLLKQFHITNDVYDRDLNFIKTVHFPCLKDSNNSITIKRGDIWTRINSAYAVAIREVGCYTFDCKSDTETYIKQGSILDCGVAGGQPTGWILCEDDIHAYVGFEYNQMYSVIKLNLDTYNVVERLTFRTDQQQKNIIGKYFFSLKNVNDTTFYYDILGVVNNTLVVINSVSFPRAINGFNYNLDRALIDRNKLYVPYRDTWRLRLIAVFDINTSQQLGMIELTNANGYNVFNIKDGLGVIIEYRSLRIVDGNLNNIYETQIIVSNCNDIYISDNLIIPKNEMTSDLQLLYRLVK